MALPSEISTKDRISSALRSYVAGVEDRFGGTELTTLIGVLKAEGVKNRSAIEDAIIDLLNPDTEANNQDYFLALSRIVSELNIQKTQIVAEVEALLKNYTSEENAGILSLLLRIYVDAGGDLTPRVLNSLDYLREFRPKHWASFAIRNAYLGDVEGLSKVLVALNADQKVQWKPSYLIDLFDDFTTTYPPKDAQFVFKEYVKAIASDAEREELYEFYQGLTGRNMRPSKTIEQRVTEIPTAFGNVPNVFRFDSPSLIDNFELEKLRDIRTAAKGSVAVQKKREMNREQARA